MYFSGRAGKTGCSITLIERRDRKQAEVKIKPLLLKTVLTLVKNVLIYTISMNNILMFNVSINIVKYSIETDEFEKTYLIFYTFC